MVEGMPAAVEGNELRTRQRRAWPLLLTAAIAAGALVSEVPLRDAVTRRPVPDVVLYRPFGYLLLAPVCEILDALTLLSSRQHLALIATTAALLVAWRLARARSRGSWQPGRDVAAFVAGTLGVATTYLLCVVPRPMAALRVTDPDVVVVDFHSHTNASRDARKSFTVEHNRAWHRAAGFHAAYVTDHSSLGGATLGMAANPSRAGDDTVLLPGMETRGNGLILLALGVTGADAAAVGDHAKVPGRRSRVKRDHAVAIATPVDLDRPGGWARVRAGIAVAIEVSDGSPRGLEQTRREHDGFLALARRENFATVAGSNIHGWAQTAQAWTLLRIAGWRDLSPAGLGTRIEALLRAERLTAARVIERHAADPGTTLLGLALTLPAVAWHMVATVTAMERLSFLAWIWGLAYVARTLRRPGGQRNASRRRWSNALASARRGALPKT